MLDPEEYYAYVNGYTVAPSTESYYNVRLFRLWSIADVA